MNGAGTEALARKPMRRQLTSGKLDMDQICRLLKVDSLSVREEWVLEHNLGSCWDPELSEDDNLANEAANEAEASDAYVDAIMGVIKECFDKHGLDLVPVPPKGRRALKRWDPDRAWEYRVQPTPGRSWRDVADNIRRTINGVGMFEFATTREFLDSGPYTAREAVLTHLGWIPDWYEVYEGGKAASRVERRLR